MCGQQPQSQLGETSPVTAGPVAWRGGGGLVLHGQPRFQLNQGLTLIPAPHTDAHDAERGGRQRPTEDLLLTYRHGFITGSDCRVRVGILISELRVEASKPQVNIHPCVIAKWITFATPLYCNLAKDYYPPNTCTYNLFNLAPRRADEAV